MGYEYKAVIDGTEYFNADIYSCVAENNLMLSNFEIGNVVSGRLDITVKPKPGDISRMASVDLYVRETGTVEWREKGKYFIAKRRSDKDGTHLNLECYDIIRSFTAWFRVDGEQPEWPMSMTDALNAICTGSSIELDPRTIINPAYMLEYPNERTIREVLSDIASAHGGNFIITDAGLLRLVPANNSGAEYDIGLKCMGYTETNNAFLVQRVTMFWDDGEYFTAGTNGGELIADNTNATQQIVNNVYQQLDGHLHIPYEASKAFIEPFFELGDTVIIDGNRRAINGFRTYFSAEIASDLKNPSDDEIDDEFEYRGNMELALSRMIKEGSWYYGVSITRKHGIQIKRTDGASEMTMNSDVWEVIVGGKRIMYIDYTTTPPTFIFNGELGADVIIAKETITETIYAENGSIADLTVDSLRTDYERAWRYLYNDLTPLEYITINNEEYRMITATTDGSKTEQFRNADGSLLWWHHNEIGGKMTTTETDEPVIVFVYDEQIKYENAFRSVRMSDGEYTVTPSQRYGIGFPNGRGKFWFYKDVDGQMLLYEHSNGDDVFIKLGEDGIVTNPSLNILGYFDELVLDLDTGASFTVKVGEDYYNFDVEKDEDGRIASINGHGKNRPIIHV